MAFVHCKEMRFWQIIREVCVCIGTGKLEGRCWPGRAHYCEEPCQCCVCVYVRVDACVWFRICVNMASILLLKTKKKRKRYNMHIFSKPSISLSGFCRTVLCRCQYHCQTTADGIMSAAYFR